MNPTPPDHEELPCRRGGLVLSNDPESHAVGSIATVRAPQVEHVKGNDPVKKEYSGPPGDGVEREVDKLHSVKLLTVKKFLTTASRNRSNSRKGGVS
jgi:hypothetical protein